MVDTFNDFGLPEKLLKALARIPFTSPTPIQEQAIPLALAGRDVLGSAQTGTGKTGAFGIPLISKLMESPDACALILMPTRELATQVVAALQQMIPVENIKTALLIGGEAMPRQFRQLQQKPRLVVGTPGRVNDHLTRGSLKLNTTRFLVLDEADRMLDMGFGVQIEKIIKHLPGHQTLMFSATLTPTIVKLSAKYLNNPERISIGSSNQPLAKIQQEIVRTTTEDKYKQLLIQLDQRKGSIIVFAKTKFGTQRLADRLQRAGHQADAIHGDLQQRRRDRVIKAFREKEYRILVATDVAARGLDIPHIEHVINYDLPQAPEDYIHRIGRTARAGAEGAAVNFLTSEDEQKWRAIHRLIHGKDAPREDGTPYAAGPKGNNKNKRRFGPPKKSFKPHSDRPRTEGKPQHYGHHPAKAA